MKQKHLIIRTYQEKVDRTGLAEGEPGKVLRGEYELVNTVDFGPGINGDRKLSDHLAHGKKISGKNFIQWIPNGYRCAMKSYYGIRSYKDVTIE